MKLLASQPGWTSRADVVVIGSGVAGLTAALNLRASGLSVLLVTKARIDEGSTKWAQGGIAAALGPGDTPEQHKKDTLVAGAGLCKEQAVNVLVSEGPEAVRKLISRGALFDKSESGEIALTREGGHLRNRILPGLWLQPFMRIQELKSSNMHSHWMRYMPRMAMSVV